jgi:hypothetical protein
MNSVDGNGENTQEPRAVPHEAPGMTHQEVPRVNNSCLPLDLKIRIEPIFFKLKLKMLTSYT